MKLFTQRTLFDCLDEFVPDRAHIIEAGAFNGTDTLRLARWRPLSHVHAFEPVPNIFSRLKANTMQEANVTCYPYALSDRSGQQTFYLSEHPNSPGQPFQAGSLCEPYERLSLSPVTYPHTTKVTTFKLDEWAEINDIDRIGLLWLDVQGHTLPVLRKATQALKTTSALYVEVEFVQAYKDQALYEEIVVWLSQHGFKARAKDFHSVTKWFFGNVIFVNEALR